MPEIVILGAGVAGLTTAKRLVGRGHNVTVVTSTAYLEWPLAGSYSLTRPEEHWKALSTQGAHYVQGAMTTLGTAVGIAGNCVRLQDGRSITFDVLVVATGIACRYFMPQVGQSCAERKEEVRKIGRAVRAASTVLIGGGGTVAIEFAGDVRDVNPSARIVCVVRAPRPLAYLDDKYSRKLAAVLSAKRIEVLVDDSVQEAEAVLESRTFRLASGRTVDADVYIPAFSTGGQASFTGLANERGEVEVNDFLQAKRNLRVFAVGCSDIEFSSVMKIQAQAESVATNALALLAGTTLRPHLDSMPGVSHPLSQKVGHDSYAWVEYELLPLPVGLLLKCCGFPCWSCSCCWPLALCGVGPCHPCACGVCCGDPEGSGTMALLRVLKDGAWLSGIWGLGSEPQAQLQALVAEVQAPGQESMADLGRAAKSSRD